MDRLSTRVGLASVIILLLASLSPLVASAAGIEDRAKVEVKPIFQISSYSVSPSHIKEIGDALSVSVTVNNTSGIKRTLNIGFEIIDPNGGLRSFPPQATALEPEETSNIALRWIVDSPLPVGYYDVKIAVWTYQPHKVEVVEIPNAFKVGYELFIEIDYMPEHKPTQSVLEYVRNYYSKRLISITFVVDEEIPLDESVTEEEFWWYEATYNSRGDDKVITGQKYRVDSKWKWVLYGTVDAEGNASGYTAQWREDAANYVLIADEANDAFAASWWGRLKFATPEKAESVTLMHELGHCIGILRLDQYGKEDYDEDRTSVMAEGLSTYEFLPPWIELFYDEPFRYSEEYWGLRNMEYYAPL